MVVEAPSKEEFERWKTDPVTEWYLSRIAAEAEHVQDFLAVGDALKDSAEATAMLYSRQVGVTNGLIIALQIEPPSKEALQ